MNFQSLNKLFPVIRRLYLTIFYLLCVLTLGSIGVNTFDLISKLSPSAHYSIGSLRQSKDNSFYRFVGEDSWEEVSGQEKMELERLEREEFSKNSKEKDDISDLELEFLLMKLKQEQSMEPNLTKIQILEIYHLTIFAIGTIIFLLAVRYWLFWIIRGKMDRKFP